MKLFLLIVCLLSLTFCDNWAILVAGSHTYANYRHQADVYHAYQVLKKNGFSQDRIITFAYDDIAHNIRNPFKGKVFNKPSFSNPGIDVYDSIFIDYKGNHVQPAVFLHVLEGNKSAVSGVGSGKVLQSTNDDNVFIYFADHGAPGLIAFPNKNLYAKDLLASLAKINGRYNKLVFYVEACESGSMFTNLPNNTKIYALSAANPSESSWGTYCSPQDVVQGKHIGSCLGDLFSVNFLQDSEQNNIFSQTLDQQFEIIKTKTDKSHVLQWGDMSFKNDKVAEYISYRNGMVFTNGKPIISQLRRNGREQIKRQSLNSRTLKMQTLMEIYSRQQTEESLKEFIDEVHSVQFYDKVFQNFNSFFGGRLSFEKYDAKNIHFECLRQSIDYFEAMNGRFSDFGFGYIKYIARACQIESVEVIKQRLSVSLSKQLKNDSL